ncbi:MAG: addiction module protein [Bacteroidales bacterium]
MKYTFQITDVSPQSKSIINMLLTLSKDYDFLKVITEQDEEEYELSPEQEKELERRYKNFLKNPKNGKTWDEVKKTLLA